MTLAITLASIAEWVGDLDASEASVAVSAITGIVAIATLIFAKNHRL